MRRRSPFFASGLLMAIFSARTAHAIDPGVAHEPSADPPIPYDERSVPTDNLVDYRSQRSWNEGQHRPFLSTTIDVGWVYLRPRLSVGYGKPFNTWVGVDANPVVSGNGAGAYGGLRLALPRFDVRAGARYIYAFNREYLNPQPSYDRLDLSSTAGSPARILTYEVEAEFSLPAGPGDVIGLGSLSYVNNVPQGMYVFEETLRVVVDPPLVWRGRGGYLFRFGAFRQHFVGVVADVLNVPERHNDTTVRIGPVLRIVLSRHLEVRGSFVPTILSPDRLALTGGDFTELGFRYRWATE